MYLLGVAAFNGDYQPKDWVRAYALMTRAASAGLPQAMDSLKTMNATIPLQQRQMGASLASDLEKRTSDTRSRELAAAELGVTGPSPVPGSATPVVRAPASASTGALASAALPPSQSAPRPVQPDGPVLAGASFAHPVEVPRAHAVAKPEARVEPRAKAEPRPKADPKVRAEPKPEPKPERKPEPRPRPGGAWRIQLGAFSQKSNADAIWARARAGPNWPGIRASTAFRAA
jgi:cell division septation protein DedD